MMHSLAKRAIIFTGPAGVGKTTISKFFIDQVLKEKPNQKIYYFQGDCFAHMNCPWNASSDQLDLKYHALTHTLELFFSNEALYVVDDVFRRKQDLERILNCFETVGINSKVIFLNADFDIISQRNRTRSKASKILKEETLLSLYNIMRDIIKNFLVVTVNSSQSIEHTFKDIKKSLKEGM